MTPEKFEIEINTLKKFFELYCKDKHENHIDKEIHLEYQGKVFTMNLSLCEVCHDSIKYSHNRLLECPHDIKPRCRTCPTPCYEKTRWKNIAKIMKYSAIKLSLSRVKKRIKSMFS